MYTKVRRIFELLLIITLIQNILSVLYIIQFNQKVYSMTVQEDTVSFTTKTKISSINQIPKHLSLRDLCMKIAAEFLGLHENTLFKLSKQTNCSLTDIFDKIKNDTYNNIHEMINEILFTIDINLPHINHLTDLFNIEISLNNLEKILF